MERLRARLYAGMAERGITGEVADAIFDKLAAFANFGFPESHSVSFAYLVYSSAWFKLHYPAAFSAGLLNAQPMGFWSPQTLVADARRHGVRCSGADVNASSSGRRSSRDVGETASGRCDSRLSVGRAHLRASRSARRGYADGRPYGSMEDLVRRAVSQAQLEALATAGAFGAASRGAAGRREAHCGPPGRGPGPADRLPGMRGRGRRPRCRP